MHRNNKGISTVTDINIATNLATVNRRMREYEKKYGRTPNSVRLLAVSKGQSIEKIKLAYAAGQRYFGENYLQEALEKIDTISRHCEAAKQPKQSRF